MTGVPLAREMISLATSGEPEVTMLTICQQVVAVGDSGLDLLVLGVVLVVVAVEVVEAHAGLVAALRIQRGTDALAM